MRKKVDTYYILLNGLFAAKKQKLKKCQKGSQDMLVILTDNSGMAKIKLIDESGTFSRRS